MKVESSFSVLLIYRLNAKLYLRPPSVDPWKSISGLVHRRARYWGSTRSDTTLLRSETNSLFNVLIDSATGDGVDPHGLGLAANLPPGAFEQSINMLQGETCGLWNSQKDVNEGHEAPPSEEYEGPPIVHTAEYGWGRAVESEVEKPVEGLR